MIGPNLSEWAIGRRSLVVYFMIVALVAGGFAFFKLGRNEDPAFTFRTMIVSAVWPGATYFQAIQTRCGLSAPAMARPSFES